MNRPPRQERAPRANFLDPSLRLTFSFDDTTAVEYLPEVTQEELRTRQERYRLFLGHVFFNAQTNEAVVSVQGILDCENDQRYYTESLLEVSNVNMPRIKALVEDMKTHGREYSDLNLVGEVHTHPVLPHETPGVDQGQPSPGDIEAYVNLYRNRELTGEFPFIFGVGAPDEVGETRYSFWRVVQNENRTYDLKQIELA